MKIQSLAIATLISAMAPVASAALIDRGNGLIYDDILDVTWTNDVRLAWTLGYDSTADDFSAGASSGDDYLTHDQAIAFTSALNTQSFDGGTTTGYKGATGWRLPQLVNFTDAELVNSGFSSANAAGVQNRGRNITDTRQELAHLYNVSLGGDPSASAPNDCQTSSNGGCLFSTADLSLFINTDVLDISDAGLAAQGLSTSLGGGSRDGLSTFFYEQLALLADGTPESNRAYSFIGRQGYQNDTALNFGSLDGGGRAWAVIDGDIGTVVPVPAAAWLFGSALGGLMLVRRK